MASDEAPSTPAPGAAPKSRRPHRKSRDGCAECKRRHIRCDKGRPACTNCTIAERACAYPATAATASASTTGASATGSGTVGGRVGKPRSSPQVRTPNHDTEVGGIGANSSLSGSNNAASASRRPLPLAIPKIEEPITPAATASPSDLKPSFPRLPFHLGTFNDAPTIPALPTLGPSTFTARDLVLLHHASTSMPDAILGRGQTIYIIDIALRYAIESPHLIDEVLAFAALHLAYLQSTPSAAEPFRQQASELQNRALTYFTRETENITATLPPKPKSSSTETNEKRKRKSDNVIEEEEDSPESAQHGVARFLFASILGIHVVAQTLLYHQDNFHNFIARFVECMHLHRGVRTVLKPTWEGLLQTEIGPLFAALSHATATRQIGTECEDLLERIKSPELSVPDPVRETCIESVEHLQWAFDLQARLAESEGPHAPSAYFVMLPSPFVDILAQHEPLALVVLAYFGVLIHRSRRYWPFGESGIFLVRSVASQLGAQWEPFLRWPLEELDRS